VVRYCVALVGGLIAGNQLLAARQAWRDWHAWVVSDPSLADFYRTDFWVDVVTAALSVAVAASSSGSSAHTPGLAARARWPCRS